MNNLKCNIILEALGGKVLCSHSNQRANNKGAGQTARMCRLISTFVFHMEKKSSMAMRPI